MRNTEVRITGVRVIRYRMPFKKPFATSRRVNERTVNFIVQVAADTPRGQLVGTGESQPRGKQAGDLGPRRAWEYFSHAAATLTGKVIVLRTPQTVRESLAAALAEADTVAADRATENNREHPFHGSRTGLEIALLDLAGQIRKESLAVLLGGARRRRVTATSYTLSAHNSADELRRKVGIWHSRTEAIRVKVAGDLDQTLQLLQAIHAANVSAGGGRAIWLDFNESLSPEQGESLVQTLADQMASRDLPGLLTLEQPSPRAEIDALPALQRSADAATTAAGAGEIRIMPDESLWDISDLERIESKGGCRAINIKVAKSGGLLPSMEIANRAVELNPQINLYIGGMLGASDLTVWSLHQLAKAFPRLDYFTSTPPQNLQARIATPAVRVKKGTLQQRRSRRPGLGAVLDDQALEPFIQNQSRFPEEHGRS